MQFNDNVWCTIFLVQSFILKFVNPEKNHMAEHEGIKAFTRSRKDSTVYVHGGEFKMGVNDPSSKTGEFPIRFSAVKPFLIDRYPVTVEEFIQFKKYKGRFLTKAEEKGYSWVFYTRVSTMAKRMENVTHPMREPWWYPIREASWDRVVGLVSEKHKRSNYPVVHVTYYDAYAFCAWRGKRLPTEYEWEYAARGGLDGKRYPWGDQFKRNRMNVWQGSFPMENKAYDGHDGLAPVDAFAEQNDIGLYDMVGNTWEWTSTQYDGEPPEDAYSTSPVLVLKGGSFIDSRDGSVNLEARCSSRIGLPADYSAENIGFRCVESIQNPKKQRKEEVPTKREHRLEDTAEYKQKVKDTKISYGATLVGTLRNMIRHMRLQKHLADVAKREL